MELLNSRMTLFIGTFWFVALHLATTAAPPTDFVVVTDQQRRSISRVDLVTGEWFTLPVLKAHTPWGVAYNPDTNTVYWSDRHYKWIANSGLEGNPIPRVYKRLCKGSYPQGLAVDTVSQLLYLMDRGQRIITATNLHNQRSVVIIAEGLENPRAIALDHIQGYMYWTDAGGSGQPGSVPRIERAFMDGTHRARIITTQLQTPDGIAIDQQDGRLYWTDSKADCIGTSLLDGSDRRILVQGSRSYFRGIAVNRHHIYVTGHSATGIQRMNKDASSIVDFGESGALMLVGITLYTSGSGENSTNSCSLMEDQSLRCDHLCIPTPLGKSCACEEGWSLTEDNHTCVEDSIADMSLIEADSSEYSTTVASFTTDSTSDFTMSTMATLNITPTIKQNMYMGQVCVCADQNTGSNVIIIAAMITAGVVVIVVVAALIWCTLRRRTQTLAISTIPKTTSTTPSNKVYLKIADQNEPPNKNGHTYEEITNANVYT